MRTLQSITQLFLYVSLLKISGLSMNKLVVHFGGKMLQDAYIHALPVPYIFIYICILGLTSNNRTKVLHDFEPSYEYISLWHIHVEYIYNLTISLIGIFEYKINHNLSHFS